MIIASKLGILQSDIQFNNLTLDFNLRSFGVLYAIKNDAVLIDETDSPFNIKFPITALQQEGLVKYGSKLFKPYEHFGVYLQSAIVPKLNYVLTKVSAYIEHVVADDVTVVDLLWNSAPLLVQSHNKYKYDTKSPPVFLGKGVFSPFVSPNTIFRRQSFWCLYLPIADQPEYSDLYRNLICQRLLWEIGGTVGFYPPTTRTITDTTLVFNDNLTKIREKVIEMVLFLSNWTCGSSRSRSTLTVYKCMIELVKDLVRADILQHINTKLVKTWINTLHDIKYTEPKRVPVVPETTMDRHLNKFESNFVFYPPREPRPQNYYLDKLSLTCPNLNSLKREASSVASTPSDLILIVVFNFPHYNNVPIIQAIYGQTFSQIIFCGSNKTEFEIKSRTLNFTGSFVEIDIWQGVWLYRCMSQVMKLNHNVAGYLQIGDDVLINPWKIRTYPQDKIWLIKSTGSLKMNQTFKEWVHWDAWYGRPALAAMFSDLQKDHPEKYSQIKRILAHNTGHPDSVYFGGADVAYVPTRLREDVKFFLDFFTNHSIHLEIAFHTVLYGIEHIENTFTLADGYMWTADKADYAKKFSPEQFFIHPYKIGPRLKTDDGKRFFCNKYAPNLFLN